MIKICKHYGKNTCHYNKKVPKTKPICIIKKGSKSNCEYFIEKENK